MYVSLVHLWVADMMQLLYKPLLINYQIFVAVSKVESNVGDSVNISWTAPFFPRAGAYTVYHTGNVNRSIIVVTSSGVTFDQTKYEYQSRPFDSTNINFTIKDYHVPTLVIITVVSVQKLRGLVEVLFLSFTVSFI